MSNDNNTEDINSYLPADLLSSSPELQLMRQANRGLKVPPPKTTQEEVPVFGVVQPVKRQAPPAPTRISFPSPEEEALGIPMPQILPRIQPGQATHTYYQDEDEVQESEEGRYVPTGYITVDELVNGNIDEYTAYDEDLLDLLKFTQDSIKEDSTINVTSITEDPIKKNAAMAKIDNIATRRVLSRDLLYPANVKNYLIASVVNEIVGLGPLEPLWQDPTITEVIVNTPREVWIEREGSLMKANGIRFRSPEHIHQLSQRIVSASGNSFDQAHPTADSRLSDGSRVNLVHVSLAPKGGCITIRRFSKANRSIVDLVKAGALDYDMAGLLAKLVYNKASMLVVGGTSTGKALDIDTPIPTPKGFVKMGDLQVGDTVFDEQGKTTIVIGAYDEQLNRSCYAVKFSDGSVIVADAEHLWLTYDDKARGILHQEDSHSILVPGHSCEHSKSAVELLSEDLVKRKEPVAFTNGFSLAEFRARESEGLPSIKSTEDILSTLLIEKRYNHSIPIVANAVLLKQQVFGIEPRTMGSFLAMPMGLREEFLVVNKHLEQTILKTIPINYQGIPENYLFSSENQRREMLHGLESIIGSTSPGGYSSLTTASSQLRKDLQILLASLGYQVQLYEEIDSSHEKLYTIEYRAPHSIQDSHRYIVGITPVESRPVRCIRVINESHLFLAGTSFIPTHNTTMLNALSAFVPRNERVITIEDTLELRLHPRSHVVSLEARPKDAAQKNAIDIKDLVKNALRMRPDRIIVGEVRGAEALNMLEACNTGHEGSMSTVHANGPDEALARLAVMIAQGAEMPSDKVDWLVGSALDIMIQIRRYADGSRRISGIYEVPSVYDLAPGEQFRTIPLYEWQQTSVEDNGRVIGSYTEINKISDHLRKKLGLDFAPEFTWDDISAMAQN